jgi:hypothetical protein
MITQVGCKALFTSDGLDKDLLAPKVCKENPDGYTGQRKWKIFVKEELAKLKPDVALIDFLSPAPFEACDELGIKIVANLPGPLILQQLFGSKLPFRDMTSNCCGFLCIR